MLDNKLIIQGKIVNTDTSSNGTGNNCNGRKGVSQAQILIDQEKGLISKVLVGKYNFVSAELVDKFYPDTCIIFPGFIDVHVHAREDESHDHDYKETFSTMSRAALNGGVVAVCEMSNNPIPPFDLGKYREKDILAAGAFPVDVLIYAAIKNSEYPNTFRDYSESIAPVEFRVPFKVFIENSKRIFCFKDYEALSKILEKYSGENISFHCEDPDILDACAANESHCSKRPANAEVYAIEQVIRISKQHGIIPKICHVSTKKGLEFCIAEGVDFEITPHHLYFTEDDYNKSKSSRKFLQMNPPLRTEEDRQALLNILETGIPEQISRIYFASDHAPHTVEEKMRGISAPSGVPHLDTYGAFITWLIKEQEVPLAIIQKICSENPGRFISQFTKFKHKCEKFGKLEPGYIASLTILNLSVSDGPITRESLKTKCKWSPFEDIIFPGRVEDVYVRGMMYDPKKRI